MIADTVAADQEQYTEGFLGKPNADYCKWIQDKLRWGGAIELAILSRSVRISPCKVNEQVSRLCRSALALPGRKSCLDLMSIWRKDKW